MSELKIVVLFDGCSPEYWVSFPFAAVLQNK